MKFHLERWPRRPFVCRALGHFFTLLLLISLHTAPSLAASTSPLEEPPLPHGYRCAKLPLQQGNVSQLRSILFQSLALHSMGAPDAPTKPFDCAPLACDRDTDDPNSLKALPEDGGDGVLVPGGGCSLRWPHGNGTQTFSCGRTYRGFNLSFSDIVIGIPTEGPLLSRLEHMLGRRLREPGSESSFLDVATEIPGVMWNSTAFRSVNLFLLVDCLHHGPPSDRSNPRDCSHADGAAIRILEEVSRIRQLGVKVNFTMLSLDNVSRWFTSRPHLPVQAEMTRALFQGMYDWLPGAHYYAKMDTDTILFPDRLLLFLQTLEAAVGTDQPVSFGNEQCCPVYPQGHFYGLNGNLMQKMQQLSRFSLEGWNEHYYPEWAQHISREQHEDRIWGFLVQDFPRVHCEQFVASPDANYFRHPANRVVREPVTFHHLADVLKEDRARVPDRLCPPIATGWFC